MSILVTGCAGFIASHIIERLIEIEDRNIVGVDNFYSGTKENLDYINSIDKDKKFNFIEADIRDFKTMDEIIDKHGITQVYHLAAIVSVQESIQNPLFSNDVNVRGTLSVLEASRKNSVKRVVFSSSAAVYGDEPTQPKNENSITKPISPYGLEKLIGEQYMNLYSKLYGLETVVLRYFNVYGERQLATSDYSGVISIFDDRFKMGEAPSIYGDGEQYRDFVYVKDVASANIKAMNTDGISGEVFCVGTSRKISINELFDVMNVKHNRDFKPNYLPSRDGDIRESLCDNARIKHILKVDEFKNFEDGIQSI